MFNFFFAKIHKKNKISARISEIFIIFADMLMDKYSYGIIPVNNKSLEKNKSYKKSILLVLAVTLHNIPEGLAVGVAFGGVAVGIPSASVAAAMTLALGIGLQNFPEGAIISLPLRAEGMKRSKAFVGGVLSGIVEPIGAVFTILMANQIVPALPYLLSFAAGAMLYVVVEELIPEMSEGKHSNIGTLFFAVGFSVMMILDVALG